MSWLICYFSWTPNCVPPSLCEVAALVVLLLIVVIPLSLLDVALNGDKSIVYKWTVGKFSSAPSDKEEDA
jgi:hypothetical protein